MEQNGDHASEGLPARPREELHNLAKNIADCTELHLARRGITHLADMEAFESLEVLWVNDNCLSRISSLDYNPTIKSLYAHNNRIGTLKGSLPTFTFVHTLTLGNNRIGNLQASLKILRLMRHLRYLELSGNPLAEETGYRLLVIKAMPWLEMLDMHRITDSERSAARRTRVPKSWQASARESHGDSVRVTQDLAAKEAENDIIQGGRRGSVIADAPSPEARPVDARRAKALLHQELSRMSAIVKHRRILLKEWFVAEDVRREEAVTQDIFIRCLRLHGLWPDLGLDGTHDIESAANAHSPPYTKAGFLSGNVGLVAGILLEAFQTPTPRRAVALGRDPAYLEQSFVDYVSFCGAVEPKTGGRDLDNQSRVLDKAWKAKPKESRSGGKPRLESLKAGSPDRGDRDGGRESTETERRETAVLLPTRAPMACEFTKSHTARGPARLDHWERIELKRILEAVGGGDVGKSTPPAKQQLLTREQVFAGLEKMVTHGRRPRVFAVEALLSSDDDSINNLSRSANGGGGGGSSLAAATDDTGLTNLDVFFDAAVALSSSVGTTTTTTTSSSSSSSGGGGRSGVKANGGGSGGGVGVGGEAQDTKADVGVLLRLMEEGLPAPGGVAPLEWEWLSCEEAGERARKFYREAAHAQRRLLLISDGEDEPVRQEAARIRSKIATLTRNAARLDTLASSSLHASSSSCSLYPSDGGDHGAGRARGGLFSASSPLGRIGRVDVYVATDFHGRPFQEQEDSGNRPVHEAASGGGAAATAAASVSRSCNTSLASSISLGPAEKGPVVGGGGGGGEGGGEGGVKVGTGRPWFSRHVLTTG